MDATAVETIHEQLSDRRRRLERAISETGQVQDLVRLLEQVDAALTRVAQGTYGRCDVCGESIEDEQLAGNPFLQYCLCRLDSKQLNDLQHDLDLAQHIQAGLLPRQDFRCCGFLAHYRYEPAGPVSGDYCDILNARDGDGDLYFAVADVSGKGVAAALLMAHLNASFRSLIQVGLPLQEIVARQNRLLLETNLPSLYATLVCGKAERSGRVEICNAGHLPPLLARRRGVTEIAATGFPIGMVGERAYSVMVEQIDPGETLLLYTDGLVEARNDRDEEFGQARLVEHLGREQDKSPRALADSVLRAQRAFTSGAPSHDDLSLMVIRRTD